MPRLVTVDDEILKCPRCGSDQLEESKKGFDEGLGTLGMLIFGPIGLFAACIPGKCNEENYIVNFQRFSD